MITTPLYDSPQQLRRAKQAVHEAMSELYAQHCLGIFDGSDPNHPRHNNGINYTTGCPDSIMGYETKAFLQRQCKP